MFTQHHMLGAVSWEYRRSMEMILNIYPKVTMCSHLILRAIV